MLLQLEEERLGVLWLLKRRIFLLYIISGLKIVIIIYFEQNINFILKEKMEIIKT